jgi:NAD(P)-dependent dehydrogenase (short-subunit alcohol dehydrogenase family)
MTNESRRVVLLTGASSGIGRATMELLAARGHWVFGGARSASTTRLLAGVEPVTLDVRDGASVKACVEDVRSRAERIDVLINNAGINGGCQWPKSIARHRLSAKRVVAVASPPQHARRSPVVSACGAAVIGELIGIPSHLLLPPLRCPAISVHRDRQHQKANR